MKNFFLYLILLAFACISTAFVSATLSDWKITEGYAIKFDGGNTSGAFYGLEGDIEFDPQNWKAARMDVVVDATTIETGNTTKDKHARGKAWFHVEKYPEIRFTSSQFSKTEHGYQVTGMLDLHGEKREVVIPFMFTPKEDNSGLFTGRFTIDRTEYDIKGNMFGALVSDDFEVTLRVPVMPNSY